MHRLSRAGLIMYLRRKAIELGVSHHALMSEMRDRFERQHGRDDDSSLSLEELNSLDWSATIDKVQTNIAKRRNRDGNGNPT